jgi:hypothetical protein
VLTADEVGAVDVDVCSLRVMVETLVVVCVEGKAMIVLGTDVDVVLVVIKALVVADELNKVLLDFGLVFDGDTRRGPSLVPAVVFFVVAVGLVVGSINSSMALLMLWCSDWKLS